MVIVYCYMSTIDVLVIFLKNIADGETFCFDVSISRSRISQGLTCQGNQWPSCMSTKLSLYSLASVWIMMVFSLLKYASVVLRRLEQGGTF